MPDKFRLADALLGKSKPLNITDWEIKRIQTIHPWASRGTAIRIIKDHKKLRTTTKEGKRAYMRIYMQQRRRQAK